MDDMDIVFLLFLNEYVYRRLKMFSNHTFHNPEPNATSFIEDVGEQIHNNIEDIYYNVMKAAACYALLRLGSFVYSLLSNYKKTKVGKLAQASEKLGQLAIDICIVSEHPELNKNMKAVEMILGQLGRKPVLHNPEELQEFQDRLTIIKTLAADVERGISDAAELLGKLAENIQTSCEDIREKVGIFDPIFGCAIKKSRAATRCATIVKPIICCNKGTDSPVVSPESAMLTGPTTRRPTTPREREQGDLSMSSSDDPDTTPRTPPSSPRARNLRRRTPNGSRSAPQPSRRRSLFAGADTQNKPRNTNTCAKKLF